MLVNRCRDKEDVVYIQDRILLSHKKNEMPSAATWTDLEIIILTEVSQRKTNIMASLICGILKNDTNELLYKTEINSQIQKT